MGLSLGRKQPGQKLKGYGPNPAVKSTSGISRANGVVGRKTSVAKSVNNAKGTPVRRNGGGITDYPVGANQTVGLRGAKLTTMGKVARVGNSTKHKGSINPRQIHPTTGPTSGLKGVSPNGLKGTAKTNFGKQAQRTSTNSRTINQYTVGPSGVGKKSGFVGTAPKSNVDRGSGNKNSKSVYSVPVHANQTIGLKGTKSGNRGGIKATGTINKVKAGGLGIPKLGGRRAVSSTLPVQKANNAAIPAAVRRAAARAPSAGSPGVGKKVTQPYTAKMTLQNSSYKQQVRGGSKFAGTR